jgi:hypothetical protein
MKRLIPVLAIMLILILTAWNDAESKRYPEVRIDEVQYDHPWGGEQNNPNPPINYSVTTTTKNDLTLIGIVKSINYRYLFNGVSFWSFGTRTISTTPVTTATATTTAVSQPAEDVTQNTTQRGSGQ